MGRNLSPVLRRELANLDKDADSRKLAMKALKSYVKDLDSKAIPLFLAQVSESKDSGSSSGEYTISLYEVLARVHGPNIVPQIDNIMATIIKTLSSSPGSFPLHQACSKVVPAIARYGIDSRTPEDKKKYIISSLCKPLSDSLLGSQEGLASGAALCLKALVDADNWRFASDEIVNEVCLRVAGALEEKPTQTNSHMGLAMALAKHNSPIVEAYTRSLIRSGLRILNAGVADGNSQKRLSAIQMVNFLMKCVDPRSIFTELGAVIEEMEKCHTDPMAFVRGAAFEALQTARILVADKSPKFEKDSGSITGSNFVRRRDNGGKKNLWISRDQSPVSASPESQTVDSFIEYDSLVESPITTGQVSCNYGGRCVNRKLWKNDNGGVDVSLKDGLFPEVSMGSNVSNNLLGGFDDDVLSNNGDQSEVFSGFLSGSPRNGVTSSTTPRPQDPNDVNSDYSEKQIRRLRSPALKQSQWSPATKEGKDLSYDLKYDVEGAKNISKTGEQSHIGSESVSSTGDVLPNTEQLPDEVSTEEKAGVRSNTKRSFKMLALNLICCIIFIFLAIVISVTWTDSLEEGSNLVPT
ncbi:protein SINE1-like isoform X2 [Macadamia integrifolia]|uniref:protein SINE1-like isoform X2 n=1 Tax=Macadamia integrifolia TaxID=60698 RepID=UPI001C4F68E2|nr:protein SINE1-like isoform X2 [Macadamia integrifolia]